MALQLRSNVSLHNGHHPLNILKCELRKSLTLLWNRGWGCGAVVDAGAEAGGKAATDAGAAVRTETDAEAEAGTGTGNEADSEAENEIGSKARGTFW